MGRRKCLCQILAASIWSGFFANLCQIFGFTNGYSIPQEMLLPGITQKNAFCFTFHGKINFFLFLFIFNICRLILGCLFIFGSLCLMGVGMFESKILFLIGFQYRNPGNKLQMLRLCWTLRTHWCPLLKDTEKTE